MSSEWAPTTLTEFAEINPKRPIPKGALAPFVEMAILSTHGRDITHGIVARTFSGGGAKFANGDTLLARITPCLENGKTAFVNCLASGIFAHGSTEFIVLGPREKSDAAFLYYLARSDDFRSYAISRMEGTSGRQRVPNTAVGQYIFNCPPIEEREKIGLFLSALDDRIILLRETNATLESIAQALFKSWFVDFDPVRAKMEGRVPEGMDEVTAALFPDGLEESKFGAVPRGWLIGALAACCAKIESGGTPKRVNAEYWNGDIPWLTSGEVRNPVVFDSKEKITELGVKDSSAKLWPRGTTIVAMYGATAGEVCILAKASTANQACCGLIPRIEFRAFLFFCVRRERESLASKSSGSAQQNLNKGLVSGHQVVIPDEAVAAAYERVVGTLLDSWMGNEEQVRTLASLRDTLLSRLISGQLRLPDAENEIETIAA